MGTRLQCPVVPRAQLARHQRIGHRTHLANYFACAPWRTVQQHRIRATLLENRMPRAPKRLSNRRRQLERRRWPRLPLAIPVFVGGVEKHQKKFQEFCTLLNISAGGALLAIRKSLPRGCVVSLLIPIPEGIRQLGLIHGERKLRARVVRSAFWDLCNLYGLEFVRPLA